MMKLVYVAGPFRGPTPWDIEQNVRRAEVVALEVARLGAVPVCPHAMYRFYQGQLPDQFWIDATLQLLKPCDGILMLEGWRDSAGSRGEHEASLAAGRPVFREEEVDWPLALTAWLGVSS